MGWMFGTSECQLLAPKLHSCPLYGSGNFFFFQLAARGLIFTSFQRLSALSGGGAPDIRVWFSGSNFFPGGRPPPPSAAAWRHGRCPGPRPAYKAAGARSTSGMFAHLRLLSQSIFHGSWLGLVRVDIKLCGHIHKAFLNQLVWRWSCENIKDALSLIRVICLSEAPDQWF